MRSHRIAVMLVFVLGISVFAGGCGSTEVEQKKSEQASLDPIIEQKCSMCHSLDRITDASYDEAGWTEVVERMQKNGMSVTEDEKTQIIEALTAQ